MKHLLLLLLVPLSLLAMSGPEHLSLWRTASSLPVNRGGLGNELSKNDLKLLHRFIDLRYDHSPMDKRHLPSHNARLMGKIFGDYWNPRAVRNAVALHAVADMYNSFRSDKVHKAGVNGHAYSQKKGREAERIIKALKEGKPVRYPKWAFKEGGKFNYDKAVVTALKNQAHHIIWLKRITAALKIAPVIYYSTQAGRICYMYGVDRELAEEEALYFLTGIVSGSAIFHGTSSLLTLGSSSIATMGVGGAVIAFVLPTALSAAGIYAIDQYLKSERVDSFEDLAELLSDIPPVLKHHYKTGTKETKRNMRSFYRTFKDLKKKSDDIMDNISDGAKDLKQFTESAIEDVQEYVEEFNSDTKRITKEVEELFE